MLLADRPLQEKDIEDPLAAQSEDPHSSQQQSAAADLSHSESSDIEQEQEFISSVVSQRQGLRVHWGDLPKRTDEDPKGERGKTKRGKMQRNKGDKEEIGGHRNGDAETEGSIREDVNGQESVSCRTGTGTDTETPKVSLDTDKHDREQLLEKPEELAVEEAAAKLSLCSLSETVPQTAPLPFDSTATQAEVLTFPQCQQTNTSTESKHLPSSTPINPNQDSHNTALTNLNITQVGMSKRGAAGLRDLLKNHTAAGVKPDSIRLNLIECLRRTLKEWSTDVTLTFLYGAGHSLRSPSADVEEEKEEELDEDDLDDEVNNEDSEGDDGGLQKRASPAAPDYETLRKESQQLELRVKEFYKGTWIVSEEVEGPQGDEVSGDIKTRMIVNDRETAVFVFSHTSRLFPHQVTVRDQSAKDPVLPLVDSHSQHLIQKRITVEKLTSWYVCVLSFVSNRVYLCIPLKIFMHILFDTHACLYPKTLIN